MRRVFLEIEFQTESQTGRDLSNYSMMRSLVQFIHCVFGVRVISLEAPFRPLAVCMLTLACWSCLQSDVSENWTEGDFILNCVNRTVRVDARQHKAAGLAGREEKRRPNDGRGSMDTRRGSDDRRDSRDRRESHDRRESRDRRKSHDRRNSHDKQKRGAKDKRGSKDKRASEDIRYSMAGIGSNERRGTDDRKYSKDGLRSNDKRVSNDRRYSNDRRHSDGRHGSRDRLDSVDAMFTSPVLSKFLVVTNQRRSSRRSRRSIILGSGSGALPGRRPTSVVWEEPGPVSESTHSNQ